MGLGMLGVLGVLGMLGVDGYRDDPPTFPEINPPGTAVSGFL